MAGYEADDRIRQGLMKAMRSPEYREILGQALREALQEELSTYVLMKKVT